MIFYPEEIRTKYDERLISMLRMYDFQCPKCGSVDERIVSVGEDSQTCKCGALMKKLPALFRVNMGPVPVSGYYDENLGVFVKSNTHRKQLMEQQGVTEKGATPKPQGQAWV